MKGEVQGSRSDGPAGWFDAQPYLFDARAGLPPAAGRAVARAVLDIISPTGASVLLEIGAGTGAVGRHLAALPICYLGIDRSEPMLGVFRRKLEGLPGRAALIRADADAPWPVADRSVDAVFASRVVHLLDTERFVDELTRVCRPDGYVLLGRIERDADSLKSRLRRRRRAWLRGGGWRPRDGREGARRLLARCSAQGASPVESRVVARWDGAVTAEQLLAAWEALPAIGGVVLPVRARAAILGELRDWARRELGDLHRAAPFAERYTVEGARLG